MNNTKWKWSEDYGCFINQNSMFSPPSAFCLGDRHVHVAPGVDTYSAFYIGSTTSDWHGYPFKQDLKQALEWVQQAKEPEVGHMYWNPFSMKPQRPVKVGYFHD